MHEIKIGVLISGMHTFDCKEIHDIVCRYTCPQALDLSLMLACSHDAQAISLAVMLAVAWRTPRWYRYRVAPPLRGHAHSPLGSG